jgi:hypothetical protein
MWVQPHHMMYTLHHHVGATAPHDVSLTWAGSWPALDATPAALAGCPVSSFAVHVSCPPGRWHSSFAAAVRSIAAGLGTSHGRWARLVSSSLQQRCTCKRGTGAGGLCLRPAVLCVGAQRAGEEDMPYERRNSDPFIGAELEEDDAGSAVDEEEVPVVLEEDSQPTWQVRSLAAGIRLSCIGFVCGVLL